MHQGGADTVGGDRALWFWHCAGQLAVAAHAAFLGLAAVGVTAQWGNGLFQWSMGEVGLALTVPLCSGTMIIAACLLVCFWLHEGVTPRSALALALLITAIVV